MFGLTTFLTKQRATMFTFIWFLTAVSQMVIFQMTNSSEGFTTQITGERFFLSVCAFVFDDIWFICTSIIAVIAKKQFASCMSIQMSVQVVFLRENVTIFSAYMRFFCSFSCITEHWYGGNIFVIMIVVVYVWWDFFYWEWTIILKQNKIYFILSFL